MVLNYALPISSGQYWFASAFFLVIIMKPYLNQIVRFGDVQQAKRTMVFLLLMLILYYQIASYLGDPFNYYGGFSAIWICILYLIGAFIKRCDIIRQCKNKYVVLSMCICVLVTWAWTVFFSGRFATNYIYSYKSITLVVPAFGFLALFSKIQMSVAWKKIVAFFAPAAWGVYLIHDHILVRGYFFQAGHLGTQSFAQSPVWLMVLQVLGMSLAILAACLLVEKLRLVLFRLLKIDWLCDRFAEWADKTIRRLPMIRKLYE